MVDLGVSQISAQPVSEAWAAEPSAVPKYQARRAFPACQRALAGTPTDQQDAVFSAASPVDRILPNPVHFP